MKTVLVTGSAGFIGMHTAKRLLDQGHRVIGFDAMTEYYDISLKQKRHALLESYDNFHPVIAALETPDALHQVFKEETPDLVIHLAAQAGVRYSIEAPESYVEANVMGTFRLLEAARAHPPSHLLIASTSSVYGANEAMPYGETHRADHQMSFYAATKKATEAMAHSYAHLFDLPVTMFRFFTVYGPWGRPDMALFKFTKAITEDRPIDVYNHGDMMRDFTYIDDLVAGIVALTDAVPGIEPVCDLDSLSPVAPWRVVNIGHGAPTQLLDFIVAIEEALGAQAKKNFMPMQPGDVPATWAENGLLRALVGQLPQTDLRQGVRNFVKWYRAHYSSQDTLTE